MQARVRQEEAPEQKSKRENEAPKKESMKV